MWRFASAVFVTVSFAGLGAVQVPSSGPWTDWTQSQVEAILESSAWSKQFEFEEHIYTVRLFSARPVQMAYLRQFQLDRGYDNLPAARRASLDEKVNPVMEGSPETIIISLDYTTADAETELDFYRDLEQLRVQQLKSIAALISPTGGRISPIDYYPPSPDGTGAKFVFPRMIEGKSLFTSSDQEIRFECTLPGRDHQIVQSWPIQTLSFESSLEF